jgi:NAD(P) transhydrogenase subunit alpha
MYARNVFNFVELLVKDDAVAPDDADELVAKSCVTRDGTARFTG